MAAVAACLAAGHAQEFPTPDSWPVYHNGSVPLNDIQMFDQNNGWAVGNDGLVLRMSGGGAWNPVVISGLEANNLNAVHFLPTNTQYGWIVGEKKEEPNRYTGILRRTTDGGASWLPPADMPPLPPNTSFRDVHFAGNGTGYIACANGIVLRSTDYGASWPKIIYPVPPPQGTSIWYQSIYTDNGTNVRVVGDAGP